MNAQKNHRKERLGGRWYDEMVWCWDTAVLWLREASECAGRNYWSRGICHNCWSQWVTQIIPRSESSVGSWPLLSRPILFPSISPILAFLLRLWGVHSVQVTQQSRWVVRAASVVHHAGPFELPSCLAWSIPVVTHLISYWSSIANSCWITVHILDNMRSYGVRNY